MDHQHHPPARRLRRLFAGLREACALAFCLMAVSAIVPPVHAAEGAGTITGRVLDTNTGKYLEGAEVYIEGSEIRGSTERAGVFTLSNVPAGPNNLIVSYPGLEVKTESVQVVAGQTADVTVRLSSGDIITMGEFRVQSAKEGMSQAIAIQKISIQSKLVAAADQFGPISEGNVGEYLKYLPGLSVDYNANDARGVSLRGLNTSFTVVAVDGTPMAASSSVADTRRFEFEQIAMNNVETTELFKTVTPDIPANSTGGFVNFVTKSAFDRQDARVITYDVSFVGPSSNLSLGNHGREAGVWGNEKEFLIRPNIELNYAQRISQKIGINFNYRFSERYDDSPRTEMTWNTNSTLFSAPTLSQYNVRTEQKITHRESFAGKLDYHISDSTKLIVAGQWNWYDLFFHQRGPQFVLGASSTRVGDPTNPTFSTTSPTIRNDVLYRNKYGTTWHFNSTLSHEFANGSKAWVTPYWSHADGQYRDTSKGFIGSTSTLNTTALGITAASVANSTTAELPTFALFSGANGVPLDVVRSLSNYTLSNSGTGTSFQSRPWTTKETKTGISGHYSFDVPGLNGKLKLQTGAAFDTVEKDIERVVITGNINITGALIDNLRDEGFVKDVAYGFGSYQVVDPVKLYNSYGWTFTTPGSHTLRDHFFRNFEEDNMAAYVRADWNILPDLLFVGGARWEDHTLDGEAGNRTAGRGKTGKVSLSYDKIYPSASLKYTPGWMRSLVARAGYSQTVGHPDYADIVPTVNGESAGGAGDGNVTAPLDGLEPYYSTNYDFTVDYYLKNTGVVGLSLFRKNVSGFIATRSMTLAERLQYVQQFGYNPAEFSGPAATGSTVYNGADSTIQGVEFSYAQSLTFLPKPFSGLSVQSNFTVTDTDSDDNDVLLAQMRGAAPKSFNVILGYRQGKLAVTSSTNWTDDTVFSGLVNSEWFVGSAPSGSAPDTRLVSIKSDVTTTNLKVEYAFDRRYTVYFLINNMFEQGRVDYLRGYAPQNANFRLPRNNYHFGEPYYTLGVRGQF